MLSGRYRTGPYQTIEIFDPKHRVVSAAPFRDRVVHHAFCAVCEPIFERGLIHDSYANRTCAASAYRCAAAGPAACRCGVSHTAACHFTTESYVTLSRSLEGLV